jgi:nucleoside-diphosphate-sugar epimerase
VNVIVVGAKGFVGAALTRALLNNGHDVTAVDLRDTPGRLADVASDVRWIAGDAASTEVIYEALGGAPADAIYYGAFSRYERGTPSLDGEVDVMVSAAIRTFQLTRAFPEMRVIFPSSIAAHGPQSLDEAPVDENSALRPHGIYGAGKVFCESVAAQLNADLGKNAISCVRLPSVYGPGADVASREVNVPAVKAARGEVASLSSPRALRVCVGHVDDVADGLLKLIETASPAHTVYESGGLDVSLGDIADVVSRIVPDARTTFGDDDVDILPHAVDWSRLREEVGATHRDLESGMRSVVEFERARISTGLLAAR